MAGGVASLISLVSYIVTFFAGLYVLLRAKKHINYWPLIRLLAALIVGVLGHALAIYFLMLPWPSLMHDPVQPAGRAVFSMLVSLWGAWLVWKINRLPAGYVADLAGQPLPEDIEAAKRHLEAAAHLLKRGILDAPTWHATVDRGLCAPAPEEGGEV